MRLSASTTSLAGASLVLLISSCAVSEQPNATAPGTSQSTAATQPASSAAAGAAAEQLDACVLTAADIEQAFREFLGPGEITASATSPDVCTYSMPPGSLQLNGQGKTNPSAPSGSIQIGRTPYSSDERIKAGIANKSVSWGGKSPEEVFASSEFAFKELAAVSKRGPVTTHPESRTVFDGAGTISVAADGPHWYGAGIILASGDPAYGPAMTALGQAISAKANASS